MPPRHMPCRRLSALTWRTQRRGCMHLRRTRPDTFPALHGARSPTEAWLPPVLPAWVVRVVSPRFVFRCRRPGDSMSMSVRMSARMRVGPAPMGGGPDVMDAKILVNFALAPLKSAAPKTQRHTVEGTLPLLPLGRPSGWGGGPSRVEIQSFADLRLSRASSASIFVLRGLRRCCVASSSLSSSKRGLIEERIGAMTVGGVGGGGRTRCLVAWTCARVEMPEPRYCRDFHRHCH